MHNPVIRSLVLTLVGLNLFTPAIYADDSGTSLPETVVTATRSETKTDELATAATVYTRDDIQRLQVKTLPELLKGSTGLDVVQNGGYGQPASVYTRGTNSDHILVLIDGIKAGSVTTGTSAFELIPIDAIERVEIIRGPQSSLYGSEAIGGVIQIFTRKGKGTNSGTDSQTPKIDAEVGAGSWDTHRETANASGRWQDNWYNVGVSNMQSNGYAPEVAPVPGSTNAGGYRNTSVNARFGHQFERGEVDAFLMRAEGTNQYSGYGPISDNNKQFENQVFGVNGKWNVNDLWSSDLRLGQTRDAQSFLYPDGSFSNSINTTRWNASWLNNLKFSKDHQATIGTDYRLDQVDGSTQYDQNSRYDIGIFGELHDRLFERFFLNSSLRFDHNQAFGNVVTGSIGGRYNWDNGLSAFANFGSAFKAPTFNELYWPGYGNALLKPEESRSVEVGTAGQHDWGRWELRAYHTDVDHLINYGTTGLSNINKAQIDGLEAEISGQWLGFTQRLTGNLLSPIDRTDHTRLQRRADKTLSYDLSRSWNQFDVGATVLAQSDRPDTDMNGNPVTVNGFVTLDLRTAYHIDKNWTLSGKLANLLDKQYQTTYNYNMPARNFFFSIHYSY
jgi:vitamin B12 transporter